eukprot:5525391-Pleurochrysis_carterae.AAC.1
MNFASDVVDNDPAHGGREKSLLNEAVYERLLQPPATIRPSLPRPRAHDGGPPPVRGRDNVTGLQDVPKCHARELAVVNKLVRRTTRLLRAARDFGAEYLLEHPADRGALGEVSLLTAVIIYHPQRTSAPSPLQQDSSQSSRSRSSG